MIEKPLKPLGQCNRVREQSGETGSNLGRRSPEKKPPKAHVKPRAYQSHGAEPPLEPAALEEGI